MLTEEKITDIPPQPEIFASAGSYYIMDRRTEKQDTPAASNDKPADDGPPISHRRHRAHDAGAIGYIILALIGIAAGAAVQVLYPLEGAMIASQGGSFLAVLTDRLFQCGGFLLAEYLLGYFAAGGLLVWMLPPIYGLGAGLISAASVMAGSYLNVIPICIYAVVVALAASRSAEFSSLLLSVATGKGGVLTDGSVGSSYTIRFFFYILAILAAAIPEALMNTFVS